MKTSPFRLAVCFIFVSMSLLTIGFPGLAYSAAQEPAATISASSTTLATPIAPSSAAAKQESGKQEVSPSPRSWLLIIGIAVLSMAVWFLWAFTRKMKPGLAADHDEVGRLVLFCYVFTFLSFAVFLLPPLAVRFFMPPATYNNLVNSPVGLVKGCVRTTSKVDWELACEDKNPAKVQWALNIGGSTAPFLPSGENAQGNEGSGAKNVPSDDNIFKSSFWPVIVSGGLVVPWYFITLALVGAAVSLARRVPELQRKAISATDSLDGPRCREELEFQILQVFCAPFVAITVYNIVLPTSLAVGATLGFASGFSSEAVLMGIRAGLEPIVQYLNKTVVASTKSSSEDDDLAAVTAVFANDQELKDSQIQVRRPAGIIELAGTVKSEELRKKAEELAKGAKNVGQVTNSIVVQQA